MDNAVATALIESTWDGSITPSLIDYIRIPNKSPAFDPDWKANGHMDDAVALIANWCRANALDDMVLEVIQLEGRTPLIYIDVPGVGQDCVVLYGHLDKQPEMVGWHEGLGPWLFGFCVAHGNSCGARSGWPTCALRRDHRSLRGIRQF